MMLMMMRVMLAVIMHLMWKQHGLLITVDGLLARSMYMYTLFYRALVNKVIVLTLVISEFVLGPLQNISKLCLIRKVSVEGTCFL